MGGSQKYDPFADMDDAAKSAPKAAKNGSEIYDPFADGGSADAAPAATEEPATERRRERKRAWDDGNQGGEVYVGSGAAKTSKAESETTSAEPIPTDEELNKLSAKELKRIISSYGSDAAGCFEKAVFVQKLRSIA